ncbi:unnamed protein product [Pedinophyceae sp. YPF-701]|nr:unnamed protein product [Pedinophyceae sp. YPF-701]
MIVWVLFLLFGLVAGRGRIYEVPPGYPSKLRIGVLSTRGVARDQAEFGPLFGPGGFIEQELQKTDPAMTVEMQMMLFSTAYEYVESTDPAKRVDFVFVDPSLHMCFSSEFNVNFLLTRRTKIRLQNGTEVALGQKGGVIFRLAERTDIATLEDVRGKIIDSNDLTALGGHQTQWLELQDVGVNILGRDVRQLRFVRDEAEVVNNVLAGRADVGFVTTGTIEELVNDGQVPAGRLVPVHLDALAIQDNYPLPVSSGLYPEWGFGSLEHVPLPIQIMVRAALLQLRETDAAAQAGRFFGWDVPLSYTKVRNLQEKLRLTDNQGTCKRSFQGYESVVCPPGFAKKSKAVVEATASDVDLPCPDGYECFREPCLELPDIPFTVHVELRRSVTSNEEPPAIGGRCGLMDVCQAIEQGDELVITVVDEAALIHTSTDIPRPDTVEVRVHAPEGDRCTDPARPGELVPCQANTILRSAALTSPARRQLAASPQAIPVRAIAGTNPRQVLAQLSFTLNATGTAVVEVLIDDVQAPSSPTLVSIAPKDCSATLAGALPDGAGTCVCPAGTQPQGASCQPETNWYDSIGGSGGGVGVVVGSVLVAIAIMAAVAGFVWRRARRGQYLIDPQDLVFCDPPILLGCSSTGLLLRAELRGAPVTVRQLYLSESTAPEPARRFGRSARYEELYNEVSASGHAAAKNSPKTPRSVVSFFEQAEVANSGRPAAVHQSSRLRKSSMFMDRAEGEHAPTRRSEHINEHEGPSRANTRREKRQTDSAACVPTNFHSDNLDSQQKPGQLASSYPGSTCPDDSCPGNSGRGSAPGTSLGKVLRNGSQDLHHKPPPPPVVRVPALGDSREPETLPGTSTASSHGNGAPKPLPGSVAGSTFGDDDDLEAGSPRPDNIQVSHAKSGKIVPLEGAKSFAVARGPKKAAPLANSIKQVLAQEMRERVRVRHPNVVTVLGGVAEDPPCVVYEDVEYGTLRGFLKDTAANLSVSHCAALLFGVANGMSFLHKSQPQVLHGNLTAEWVMLTGSLKPLVSNVTITDEWRRLLLAKRNNAPPGPHIAPELYSDDKVCSAEGDVYAFAFLMAEVFAVLDTAAAKSSAGGDGRQSDINELSGRDFLGETKHRVQIVSEGSGDTLRFRPLPPTKMPEAARQLMLECCHRNPARRPDFDDIAERLGVLCGGKDTLAQLLMWNTAAQDRRHGNLPPKIAHMLAQGQDVEPEKHEEVTIVFTDIVGYTDMSAKLDPKQISDTLGVLFAKFDALCDKHGIWRVEIIGDAFMGAGNLHEKAPDHALRVCRWALDAVKAAAEVPVCPAHPEMGNIRIRVGLHCGPVTASVFIGAQGARFALFGDTVNVAARMESLSREGCVQLSSTARKIVDKQLAVEQGRLKRLNSSVTSLNALAEMASGSSEGLPSVWPASLMLRERGPIQVKGKGMMTTHWLLVPGGNDPDGMADHDTTGK